jgi:hypothetical protein
MALAVGGRLRDAKRAYEWSAEAQSPDGSWPMELRSNGRQLEVVDASSDANQCAYLAAGIWHYWLLTGDHGLVSRLWPVVRRAIDLVCGWQLPGGPIRWARDAQGQLHADALLTGNACLVLSIRSALALADLVGDPQPEWELAAARVAHTVAAHCDAFADRSRYSMDWYYPVLGGAVRGRAARERLADRWNEFVVPGRGIRCVADRPWVTAAETCELVLTLDVVGDRARALDLLRDIQFCRVEATGGYRTGWVFPDDAFWPEEQSTWTAGALVLAVDALARHSPANGLFRAADLPRLLEIGECDRHCAVPVSGGEA